MKRIQFTLSSLCCALTLLFCAAMPVAAEEQKNENNNGEKLVINEEASADVGDVVTYTLYLRDATEPIVGFDLRLFYDFEYLEYQKSSLKFEKFDVVIYNEEMEGKIPMNCSSLENKPSFAEKGQFVSASFKVKKAGNAGITYFFTDLYGDNLDYLKSYTFTYDLTAGDKALLKDATPPVNADEAAVQNNQGDFINYADGKGEENSPLKGDDHVSIGSAVIKKVVEVTREVDVASENQGGSIFNSTWFIVIVGLVVVVAVNAAVIIVSVRQKKE